MTADVRERWAQGSAAVGAFATLASPLAVETVAGCGVDFVVIDLQHGEAAAADLLPLLLATEAGGAMPLVRVPVGDAGIIMRALDLGSRGVIVPMVDTATDAVAVAAACRYPPAGSRSYGPVRPAPAAGEPLCIPMIETSSGLHHVDSIAATPGVDVLFLGAVDLALSLGVPRAEATTHPVAREAVDRIRTAADRHGVALGGFARDAVQAAALVSEGYRFVAVGSDRAALRAGLRIGAASVLEKGEERKRDG